MSKGNGKPKTLAGQQQAMMDESRMAENNTAAAAANHRNQKGDMPNHPSTG